MGQQVSVGRMVHYYDREEIVNAEHAKRHPEPYPAIVTRVHKDQDGNPTDVVNLTVFDPEVGVQLKRDVRPGDPDANTAHSWYWPTYVPPTPASEASTSEPSADDAGDDAKDDDATSSRGSSRKKK
jgi:hypothetical protein